MKAQKEIESFAKNERSSKSSWLWIFLTVTISALLSVAIQRLFFLQNSTRVGATNCHPPLPNVFAFAPLRNDSAEIAAALRAIDKSIQTSYSKGGIDGLVLAIVTREGVLYETGIGPLKANETDPEKRGAVDRHSIFRIASGSKLFAALETFILRERGALQWDDPVTKFLPDFAYASGTWANRSAEETSGPITLRQLASHMSGLTREFPRGNMKNWPHSLEGTGPPPVNGRPFPTTAEMIDGLKNYPLTVPTYSYSLYSNVGVAVLGQVNVAANRAFEMAKQQTGSPETWADLAQRDIFDPLGLNGTSFVVTPHNKAHVAVASADSDEVDLDFLEPMSCSGGQMSSLSDYVKVMQTILDPARPESLLPPHVIREWLRPIQGWMDDTTEVGMLWEIEKIRDSYARPIRIFQKLGVLGASRSVFAINQDMSYGVALLMTGTVPTSTAAGDIVLDIFRHLQPTLDRILTVSAARRYAGGWMSAGGDGSEIFIRVAEGSLWVTKLFLQGTDVLRLVHHIPDDDRRSKAEPITLWSTGRRDEFRMVFASASKSCVSAWTAVDDGFSRGFPTDLLYFSEEDENIYLHMPSVGLVFSRN